MKGMKIKSVIFPIVILTVLSCNPVKKIPFQPDLPENTIAVSDQLCISFNGVASFYILYQDKAVLTDPFLSNPGFLKLTFGKIHPDTTLIERLNPKTENIRMIVIGHAHYDHMMDLPYFANKVNSDTRVIGSSNAVKIASSVSADWKLTDVSTTVSSVKTNGKWEYASDSSIRILPIKSAHLPHIFGIHLYEGHIEGDCLNDFPAKSKRFIQDITLAYLIDFLNEKHEPVKRIYFSSSATSPDNGFFPEEILAEKKVDVAIISLALAQKADSYPQKLIAFLQPEYIIPCHWENFFRTAEKPLKWVSMTSYKKVMQSLQELPSNVSVKFIRPGYSIVF
jgi:L-ascorbate metabolism protein UlaG (beta-lactamase superfamily)